MIQVKELQWMLQKEIPFLLGSLDVWMVVSIVSWLALDAVREVTYIGHVG